MEQAYRQAGFRLSETQVVTTPLRLPSAAACAQFDRESFGALQQMLRGLPEEDQLDAWEEIEQALRQFEGPHGFEAPTELRIGLGIG
jgi:hypothetical protein